MMKPAQDCALGVVPQKQSAITRGRCHMTSFWQNDHPSQGCLVTPEGLQEGAALERLGGAHIHPPAAQVAETGWDGESVMS